jgi:hypothetical protein
MTEILPENVSIKKQEFIDSLKRLNAKAVGKLLHLNILKHFHGEEDEEDEDFCPYQVAMTSFNCIHVQDFKIKQRLCDNYINIIKLLIQHGADVNKSVYGKTVLEKQITELQSLYTRCNAKVFNLLIENGAKVTHQGFYKPYYNFMMRYSFCKCKGYIWLMKKVVQLGIYSLEEEEDYLPHNRGKRLVKSLPMVFLLYCFKRREVEALL